MKRSILLSFIGTSLAALAIAVGCGSDDKAPASALSAKGESCTRSSDCASGLACVANVCGKSATVTLPDGGTGPVTGATPLGGNGESCTRRADCQAGLSCILQTCTAGMTTPTGPDGGGVPVSPLGARGESCESVRDCAKGLTCVPRFGGSGGICDLDEYGLEPTGKVCGAECAKAEDCCELPPNTFVSDPINLTVIPVNSCADILQVLLAGDATVCNATPPPAKDPACFYYKAYCECAASTWACTDGKCVYAAKCSKDGNVFKGCPTTTRTGGATASSLCDATATKCQTAASGCTTAASCETLPVVDDPFDTCQKDECTCLDKKCYRKCNEDLDCSQRYTCDTATEVCKPTDACTGNSECAVSLGDVRAECRSGSCVLPCSSDHECSGSGLQQGGGAFNARVCSQKGICEPLGCALDDECSTGTVRTFCTVPVAAAAGGFKSAVTD